MAKNTVYLSPQAAEELSDGTEEPREVAPPPPVDERKELAKLGLSEEEIDTTLGQVDSRMAAGPEVRPSDVPRPIPILRGTMELNLEELAVELGAHFGVPVEVVISRRKAGGYVVRIRAE